MRPYLACDCDLKKIKFPVWVMPKIDGVRGLVVNGKLRGRSGKPFKNVMNTKAFSREMFEGFDGELVAGGSPTGENVCAKSTSAMTTINGMVYVTFHVFDRIYEGADAVPYEVRYAALKRYLKDNRFGKTYPVELVPYRICESLEDVEKAEALYLSMGYEGLIIRNPKAGYKHGRGTVKEGGYMRLKRFNDAEIKVTAVIEGGHNTNPKSTDVHGYAERSTHRENILPNGRVGSLQGECLADIVSGNKVIVKAGELVTIGAGKLTVKEREEYFNDQSLIIGKIAKFQYFEVGMKDRPRFPTFQCFRDINDL